MSERWMIHGWCIITGRIRLCARGARIWRRTGSGVRSAAICISKFTTKIKSNHVYLVVHDTRVVASSTHAIVCTHVNFVGAC